MKVSFEIGPRTLLLSLLMAILVWASLGKIANLQEFYGALLGYRLPLPPAILRLAALTLPWLELLTGFLLLLERTRHAALIWATALFALFAVATLQAWLRGLQISCGCFDLSIVGISPASALAGLIESAPVAFFRTLALLGAAAFLLRSTQKTTTG